MNQIAPFRRKGGHASSQLEALTLPSLPIYLTPPAAAAGAEDAETAQSCWLPSRSTQHSHTSLLYLC